MKKAHIQLLIGTSLLLFAAHTAFDQILDPCDGKYPCNPRHRTFAEELHAYGIDLSQPSLVAALQNNDPKVRSLAAYQLLTDHDNSARPAIEKALSTETDNQAKMGIASVLVGMGDPVGAKTLESMCADASLPWDVTVRVVGQIAMSQLSHPKLVSTGACADVVLPALESTSDDYERTELVTVLPSIYKDVPKDKADRMVADAQKLLGDGQVATRMQASMALTNMGSTASIELIRNAMERETDPNIRAVHQRNLDKLLKLQQQAAPTAPANTPPH